MHWLQVGPTFVTAFMASLVEFVEALTVILAVGTVRGWRHAVLGSATAMLLLCLWVAIFGQTLAHIPLSIIQGVVGTLILLFGLRWLRKAILRSLRVIPFHDELREYTKQS